MQLARTPLITIGIPTYNRAYLLDECLLRVSSLAAKFGADIEIIVSDNCSTDNTRDVCARWEPVLAAASSFCYSRNSTNIGVSKNILRLLDLASGQYFTVIGDDDCLSEKGIGRILNIIKERPSVSAVLQGQVDEKSLALKYDLENYRSAANYVYEYGNAYKGIIKRQGALAVLSDCNLRAEIEKIVWPQTVVGFLAIDLMRKRPICITSFEIGRPIRCGHSIPDQSYFLISLYGLLQASNLIDKRVGWNWTKYKLCSHMNRGFVAHMRAIMLYGVLAEKVDSAFVRRLLMQAYGFRGHFWASILFIFDLSVRFNKILLAICYSISKRESLAASFSRIDCMRDTYLIRVKDARSSGKRFGDWF